MKVPRIVVQELKRGRIAVLPTDTIYGLLGQAHRRKTVERIYQVRKRDPGKACIILISHITELSSFGISPTEVEKKMLRKVWPGPVSVVFPIKGKRFWYLSRSQRSLAFRLPKPPWLRNLLKDTGPLIAPSANLAGCPSARTIKEAEQYFGSDVDSYVDVGRLRGQPSALLRFSGKHIEIKRRGRLSTTLLKDLAKQFRVLHKKF